MAGFIGSHLAERLLADGHQVAGIDNFSSYYPRALKERNLKALRGTNGFRFEEGDLSQLDLGKLIADREWIFHEAAQPGVRSSWGQTFGGYLEANVSATQKLLEAARNAGQLTRFVYASSSSVYGDARTLPVTEGAETAPISPYGLTKLMAERLCLIYGETYKLPVVCLRYFTVYGPRQRPDMAFHCFGKAMLAREPIHVYGDGRQKRDFTFVSDVVEANLGAATGRGLEGMVINVAGGSTVSLLDAIGTLEQISGRRVTVLHEEPGKGDVRDTFADISLARNRIGYRPRVALRQGLEAQLEDLERLYSGNDPPVSS